MPAEVSNWEVWNLQLDLIQPRSDAGKLNVCMCCNLCMTVFYLSCVDFEQQQQSLVEALSETVHICTSTCTHKRL